MSIIYTWQEASYSYKYNDNLVCYIPMTDNTELSDVTGNYGVKFSYSPKSWSDETGTNTTKYGNLKNGKSGVAINDSNCRGYLTQKNNTSVSVDPTTILDKCTIKTDLYYISATRSNRSEGTTNGKATKIYFETGLWQNWVRGAFAYQTSTSASWSLKSDERIITTTSVWSGTSKVLNWMTLTTVKHDAQTYTFNINHPQVNINNTYSRITLSNAYSNNKPSGKYTGYHTGNIFYFIWDDGGGASARSYCRNFRIYNSDDSYWISHDDLSLHEIVTYTTYYNSSEYIQTTNRIVTNDLEQKKKYIRCYEYR